MKLSPLLILMSLLLVGLVSANVNVDLTVISDGDIDANIGLQGNNVDVTIDGLDFDNEVNRLDNDISNAGNSISNILRRIYELFMEYDRGSNSFKVVDYNDLNEANERKARRVFDNYFVPRSELFNIISQQQSQISQLQLEIKAIQNVIGQDEICSGRLDVAKELDLSSVKCGNTTYYNHLPGNEFIGITPVTTPVTNNLAVINEPEEESKSPRELAMETLYDYPLKLQLSQLIAIDKRNDEKGFEIYSREVGSEVKEAFQIYFEETAPEEVKDIVLTYLSTR